MQNHMLFLRALDNEDIDRVKKWIMQDYIMKWFGDVSDWLEEINGRKDQYRFIKHFIAEENGIPVGFCQYYDWNKAYEEEGEAPEPAGTYGIDYLIGDKSLLGKGMGKLIVKAVCDKIIAEEPNVLQIIADPTVEPDRRNIPSIKALEANGFEYDEKTKIYRKK